MPTVPANAREVLQLLVDGAQLIISIALLYGLRVAYRQWKTSERHLQDDRDRAKNEELRRKREATLEFVTATIDRTTLLQEQGLPRKGSDAAKLAKELAATGTRAEPAVRDYLNGLEYLAVAVHMDIFDFDTVNRLRGRTIINAWRNWQPYIDQRRRVGNFPTLWSDFEALAKELARRRRETALLTTPPVSDGPTSEDG